MKRERLRHMALGGIAFLMVTLGLSFDATKAGKEITLTPPQALAAEDEFDDTYLDDPFETGEIKDISDPLEPMNRFFFEFNDRLYFWALKPAARVYRTFIPGDFRICIRNAFHNLLAPVRIVNNTLQGKFKNAGIELSRFVINTTVGVAGFGDPADEEFGLRTKSEDLGQTLGYYGIGNGIYFCWPIFGPSTARDTAGLVGDGFLNPLRYVYANDPEAGLLLYTGKSVNNTSLVIGDYESFKESSFDPYVSLRDAYIQHRESKIQDMKEDDNVY